MILNLSAEDIAAINTGKLAVFYYNESTQNFENLAGSYDSTSNTFTFETTHLSKFVIGEADSVGNVLPQFGTFIDTTVLIAFGLTMILGGGLYI
ncbi:hypothetical protein [Clostridium cellulovorans]|uniref:hypothetical protein n=1 Tax=Clostridium cellulovorans TaxID=1493 RepID=UPI0001A97651|nr:hypothetical protein [Clostridium cellulovorans]